MGIKSLNKFLRDYYHDIFEPIHISEYHFKKVAIDTSLYLCHYKAMYGEQGWLTAFIKLVSCLRENDIHCVFIYDTGFPPEKEAERKERYLARKKLREKVFKLETAIEKYHSTGEIDEILLDFSNKKNLRNKSFSTNSWRNNFFNIRFVEFEVKKLKKQLFSISKKDFQTTKNLFDILKVPYYDAPLEAETMCADLCMRGEVDAVLTEDTDVLAYGAHVFLTKLNVGNGTCIRIKHEDILRKMDFTKEQFLDFCIMCGTDYNKNIFKIGPSRAQKLLDKNKSIDNIALNENINVSILNHNRVREIFTKYEKNEALVPYCGIPDFNELEVFLTEKNLRINRAFLESSFTKNNIVFLEENEESQENVENKSEENLESIETSIEIESVPEILLEPVCETKLTES